MQICDEEHEEVCFEGRTCPACKEKQEVEQLKSKIGKLEDEINDLESDLQQEREKNA